jgi:hypothetical protein
VQVRWGAVARQVEGKPVAIVVVVVSPVAMMMMVVMMKMMRKTHLQ